MPEYKTHRERKISARIDRGWMMEGLIYFIL